MSGDYAEDFWEADPLAEPTPTSSSSRHCAWPVPAPRPQRPSRGSSLGSRVCRHSEPADARRWSHRLVAVAIGVAVPAALCGAAGLTLRATLLAGASGGHREGTPAALDRGVAWLSQVPEGGLRNFSFEVNRSELEAIENLTGRAAEAAGYLGPASIDRTFLYLADAHGTRYPGPDFLPADPADDLFPLRVSYEPTANATTEDGTMEQLRQRAEETLVKRAVRAALRDALRAQRRRHPEGHSPLDEALKEKSREKEEAEGGKARALIEPEEEKESHPVHAAAAPVSTSRRAAVAAARAHPAAVRGAHAARTSTTEVSRRPRAEVAAAVAARIASAARGAAAGLPGPGRGSCADYGCGGGFDFTRSCQCGGRCGASGDCCHDFEAVCGRNMSAPAAPAAAATECSAEGEDCSKTTCCSDERLLCFEKLDGYAACARQCRPGIHPEDPSDFRSPWSCDLIGRPQLPSLMCFAVTRSEGPELEMLRTQKQKLQGIFSCDAHIVFSHEALELGFGDQAVVLDAQPGGPSSLEVWRTVAQKEEASPHDWLVKVDPDTVFFPPQLRIHLWGLRGELARRAPGGAAYLQQQGGCQAAGGGDAAGGPLEVVSAQALRRYAAEAEAPCGEELGLQSCLSKLGAVGMEASSLLADGECDTNRWQGGACEFGKALAYHPLESVESWWRCWGEVTGGQVQIGLKK